MYKAIQLHEYTILMIHPTSHWIVTQANAGAAGRHGPFKVEVMQSYVWWWQMHHLSCSLKAMLCEIPQLDTQSCTQCEAEGVAILCPLMVHMTISASVGFALTTTTWVNDSNDDVSDKKTAHATVVNAILEMEASVERVTQALHGLINWELREPLMDLDIADQLIFHDTNEDMATLKHLNVVMLTFDQVFQQVIEPAVEAAKAAKAAEEAQGTVDTDISPIQAEFDGTMSEEGLEKSLPLLICVIYKCVNVSHAHCQSHTLRHLGEPTQRPMLDCGKDIYKQLLSKRPSPTCHHIVSNMHGSGRCLICLALRKQCCEIPRVGAQSCTECEAEGVAILCSLMPPTMARMIQMLEDDPSHYISELFQTGVMKVADAIMDMEARVVDMRRALGPLINWDLQQPLIPLNHPQCHLFHDVNNNMKSLETLAVVMKTFKVVFEETILPVIEEAREAMLTAEADVEMET
ncbi:uncharacterized protein C8Q71DRAFT_721948 [Rhodofomes roseus]|uniref:Uncharacterized protein n=1 Tax=Rhodofomes roseus TaxID=34475 RepID=A0ABQ8KPC2_9APHY|nr:uncharacterized protein C8Q71DRAFT_721948 [Rhodofomes roseus]KAH9840239.1 hypothetical protein C8Q71DRAFT_721948 [Rhodofomes roseus]